MAVISDYRALLSGSSWTSGVMGQAADLTYSFSAAPTASIQSGNAAAAASFVPLTTEQKASVRGALAQWAAVSGITFHEVTATPGDLTFGLYDLGTLGASGAAGLGNYPSTGIYTASTGRLETYSNFLPEGGDVYFDTSYARTAGSDFAHVALHEIGHALGLKHPFDTPGDTLDAGLDNGSQTVMAYAGPRSATLQALDIAAIQALYGTRTGAARPFTVTWNAATEALTVVGTDAAQLMFGSGGDDVFFSGGGRDAISGGEGDDIVYAAGQAISVNGGPGTDTVVTGLAYSTATRIGGGTVRFLQLPGGGYQSFAAVERLDFTNGVYDLTTDTFATVKPGSYVWTGMVDGSWNTPGNWKAVSGGTAAAAPGAADTVTLSLAGSISGGGQAAGLVLGGTSSLAGRYVAGFVAVGGASTTLQPGASVAVNGPVTMAGGLVTAVGAGSVFEVGGQSRLGGGSGAFVLDAGGMLSGYGTVNAGAVENHGLVVASGGTLRLIGTQATTASGEAQIAAGATLWVQNLNGAYRFTGAGGTLRADTPATSPGLVPTLSGFVEGEKLVLSGTVASVRYAATGSGTGTLTSNGLSLSLLGDYARGVFSANADAAANTTTVTVTFRPDDPLFDVNFYLARNRDVRAAGVDPYTHFIVSGGQEGRDPSPLFSSSTYLAGNPDVRAARVNPLSHYEAIGFREGRNPSGWFDNNYYLAQNPDVRATGVNPLVHFAQSGWREGREPSLVFSDAKYLAANPDVRAAGVNPLLHFMANGLSEGRAAALAGGSAAADQLVDASFYDRQLGATLLPSGIDAARQAAWSYDATGWQAGLNPSKWFDTSYYLARNPDVAAAHVNPLTHYQVSGWREGRDPSAQFSSARYLAAYGDVRAAGVEPLLHYVVSGQGEGRSVFAV